MNGKAMAILAILIVGASMITLGCTGASKNDSTTATATPGPGDNSVGNGSQSISPGFNDTYRHDFNGTRPDFNRTYPGHDFNGSYNGTHRHDFNGSMNGTYPGRDFNGTPPDFNGTAMDPNMPNDAAGNPGDAG